MYVMDRNSTDEGTTSNATPLLRSVVVTNGSDNSQNDEQRRRPTEPWQGEFAKSIIYAGLDAIVTCFSLISSISAGRLSSGQFSGLHFVYCCTYIHGPLVILFCVIETIVAIILFFYQVLLSCLAFLYTD